MAKNDDGNQRNTSSFVGQCAPCFTHKWLRASTAEDALEEEANGSLSSSLSSLSRPPNRWCFRRKRRQPKTQCALTNIWVEAAAAAVKAQKEKEAAEAIAKGEKPEEIDDLPKMNAYRGAHSATIAPLLLGMTGLGGAMMKRSKRRMSDFTDIAHLATGKQGMQMSERQIQLLHAAWTEVGGRRGMSAGEWIVRRMSTEYPLLGQQLSTSFQMHADTLTNALDMAMDSLDALDDSLGPMFVSYGCAHGHLDKTVEFRHDYWEAFSDAMCDYAVSWKLRANRVETMQTWRLLVLFIVSKVQHGHSWEMAHPASNKSSNNSPTCAHHKMHS